MLLPVQAARGALFFEEIWQRNRFSVWAAVYFHIIYHITTCMWQMSFRLMDPLRIIPHFEVAFMVLEFFLYSFAISFRNNSALLWFLSRARLLYSPKTVCLCRLVLMKWSNLTSSSYRPWLPVRHQFFLHKHDSYPLIYVPYRFTVLFCFFFLSAAPLTSAKNL